MDKASPRQANGGFIGISGPLDSAEETSRRRSIPSLDGLRAVSIALVILSHNLGGPKWPPVLMRYLFELGQLGVNVFFVISGFLITFLLSEEKAATSTISLRRFYIRRAFRLFPAFYTYLGVLALLTVLGVYRLHWIEFVIAGLYLWNYYLPGTPGLFTHTWSLALEEQFYLFWPACVKRLTPVGALRLSLALIVLEPFIRILTYAFFPSLRGSGKISAMFHTRIDTLMFGCAVALLWPGARFQRWARQLSRYGFFPALLFLLGLEPLINAQFRSIYHALWFTFDGASIAIVLIHLVQSPHSFFGRLLNIAPLRYLGRISYGLYLWQQLFLSVLRDRFPLNVLAAVGCAALSYSLVEKPSMRLRDLVMARFFGRVSAAKTPDRASNASQL